VRDVTLFAPKITVALFRRGPFSSGGILYFSVGVKPHTQVKEEIARFGKEVTPIFDGKHKSRSAA
jgi:hypothetical protein